MFDISYDDTQSNSCRIVSIVFHTLLLLMFCALGPGGLIIVGTVCLGTDGCGDSPFPYVFIGLGSLVCVLMGFTIIIMFAVVIGDLIFIKKCKFGCWSSDSP